MYFSFRYLLNPPIGLYDYIWMDVSPIKETKKAILVMFGNRQEWFPKAWIWGIKQNKAKTTVKIKISRYHWTKKFE